LREERRPGEDLLAELIPRRATADTLGLDSGAPEGFRSY